MIDGSNFFDQPVKNDRTTYDNIQKIEGGQGDDYTTSSLLDYYLFKKYPKMIEIDLSKQQTFIADSKAIQQINFTGNVDQQTTMFIIIKGPKETILDFIQETTKML